MANLKILYPDIPYNAVSITPEVSTGTFGNEWNVVTGPRYTRYRFGSSATTRYYKFDLGTNYASKQNQATYLYVARADLVVLEGLNNTSIKLQRSSNDSSYSTVVNISNTDLGTLYGPRSEDAYETASISGAYRYWQIYFEASSAKYFEHSKVYFGQPFEFETEPAFEIEKVASGNSAWHSSNRNKYFARQSETLYKFTMTWQGISDSSLASFKTKILNHSLYNPVVLATTTYHEPLDSCRVVHCQIIDAEYRQAFNDWNELRVVFEELIG